MRLTCHPVERTKEQQQANSLHLKDANDEKRGFSASGGCFSPNSLEEPHSPYKPSSIVDPFSFLFQCQEFK